jgi:acetyltransferase
VLTAVASDPSVDVLAVYALDEPGALDPAEALSGLPVPVLFASGGPQTTMRARGSAVHDIRVPFFDSPDRLVRGVAAVLADQQAQRAAGIEEAAVPAVRERPPLGATPDEDQAKSLLEQLGLSVPTRGVAADREEAHALLGRLRAPLVVKVLDAAITHKSDVGGVHVGVRTTTELDAALDAIEAIAPDRRVRFLLEEQAPAGSELIVGAIKDPAFGAAVVVGIGGVDVELGPPPVIRLAPVSPAQARYAVDELPAAFLEGHRGAAPVDRDGLARILSAVSELIAWTPDLREVDLNPIRMTEHGLVILDALLITE